MIDFVKAVSENQIYIESLYNFAFDNLKDHKPQNNNYKCFSNGSGRFRFEFRKVYEDGNIAGFRNVEVCFGPHYLSNNDLHNGNDFKPLNAIEIIRNTFLKIGIKENEMQDFRVVNLEYGLNLNTGLQVENLISGIIYTKKTPFIIPNTKHQYFKISNSTNYKEIKAYAKGLQFIDFPKYNIDRNTFRFEVRTKQSKNIKTFGIYSVADLLNQEVYNALFQSLVNEWENILIINLELKNRDNTRQYWKDILSKDYRNKFYKSKLKYFENIDLKNNLHHLIKCKIIDKITSLQKGANSTQKTTTTKGKVMNGKTALNRINLEYAPNKIKSDVNIRLCQVTNIDISSQRKGSKFIRENTLKILKEKDPDTYKRLEKKYLTEKMKTQPMEKQFYHIAKNIRDSDSNPRNNRVRFEQMNYNKFQLQINF